jgi:hypothetical protein
MVMKMENGAANSLSAITKWTCLGIKTYTHANEVVNCAKTLKLFSFIYLFGAGDASS